MRTGQTNIVKQEWFGKNISVLLTSGKKIAGELSEVTPAYLVLDGKGGETQVMAHAIVLIRLSDTDQE